MTSQQCPAWLAVFSPVIRQKHTNQELIDFMHSFVDDKRPDIGRMLKGHEAYVALTGHDLHDKSVDGVNAFKVIGAAERRTTFPFNERKATLFADMYEGAALLHSKKTYAEAFIAGSTTPRQAGIYVNYLGKQPQFIHKLEAQPKFEMLTQVHGFGLTFGLHHKPAPNNHDSFRVEATSKKPVAFVKGETVAFNLPKAFSLHANDGISHNEFSMSWDELEQNFGITKDLYD